jgi:phosphoenolpyruvate---glycerone phosphotransferase subunit DhaL
MPVLEGWLMELTVAQIATGVRRAADAMGRVEQELNALDAKLGDGDTGSMLVRVIGAMEAAGPASASSVADAFDKLARAGMSATGSSLGTLFSGALLMLSKQTRGRDVHWSELPVLIAAARDWMMMRGGAKLGDKTVLDALDAVAAALAGITNSMETGAAAVAASERALADFRDRPCRMGRAKFFAQKSVGLDDPGMLAFARLARALVEAE